MGGIVAVWRQGVAWTQQVWPVALAISLAACGSETPTGPSGPSIPGTPVAVTVTCTAEPNGHQCRASAQLSNRTVQDVTASATWTSFEYKRRDSRQRRSRHEHRKRTGRNPRHL